MAAVASEPECGRWGGRGEWIEGEEGGAGEAHKVLKNAADSVGSALDKSQTRAFNRVKARVNEREMESRVGAWARLEGRMHVARHL